MSKERKDEEEADNLSAFNLLAGEVNIPNGGEIKNGAPTLFDKPLIEDDEEEEEEDADSGIKDKRTSKKDDNFKIQNRMNDDEEEEEEEEDEEEEDEDEEEEEPQSKKKEKKATKKEEEEEDDSNESDSPFKTFASFLHEKGIADYDPEDFEDSEEGLLKMMDTTVKKSIEKYKESVPKAAKEFLEYLEAGGDPKTYVEKSTSMPNYKALSEEALGKESVQKAIIGDWLAAEGYTDEEIEEMVEDFEESGLLEKQAKRMHPKLVKKQENFEGSILEDQKKAREAQIEAHEAYIADIKKTIDAADEIAGFELPTRKKEEFFKYITEANKEGKTKLLADIEADPQAQLKMAWLMYNKFDLSKIEKKVKTKVASKLRDSLSNLDSSLKLKGQAKRTREASDSSDLDMTSWRKAL
jgi:cbb3-type cytochrome oxidase cytochrome c subunit